MGALVIPNVSFVPLVNKSVQNERRKFSLNTSFKRNKTNSELIEHISNIIKDCKFKNHYYLGSSIEDSLVADLFISNARNYRQVGTSQENLTYSLYMDTLRILKPIQFNGTNLENLVRLGAQAFSRADLNHTYQAEQSELDIFAKYRSINPLITITAEGFLSLFENFEIKEKLADCKCSLELKYLYLIDVNLRYSSQPRAILDKLKKENIQRLAVYSFLLLR